MPRLSLIALSMLAAMSVQTAALAQTHVDSPALRASLLTGDLRSIATDLRCTLPVLAESAEGPAAPALKGPRDASEWMALSQQLQTVLIEGAMALEQLRDHGDENAGRAVSDELDFSIQTFWTLSDQIAADRGVAPAGRTFALPPVKGTTLSEFQRELGRLAAQLIPVFQAEGIAMDAPAPARSADEPEAVWRIRRMMACVAERLAETSSIHLWASRDASPVARLPETVESRSAYIRTLQSHAWLLKDASASLFQVRKRFEEASSPVRTGLARMQGLLVWTAVLTDRLFEVAAPSARPEDGQPIRLAYQTAGIATLFDDIARLAPRIQKLASAAVPPEPKP